jgi:hypothetical protein
MLITNLNTHAASYVSVAELAAYWDVTRQLIYKHIQSGLLPAICLGPRCFRVRTKDALEFENVVLEAGQRYRVHQRTANPVDTTDSTAAAQSGRARAGG